MNCQPIVFDLSDMLRYPIRLAVYGWESDHPLHWSSFGSDGEVVAEGQFLEPPGLPLFSLQDDNGNRLSDGIPTDVTALAKLMPSMAFELAQACAVSEAARQLADDAPLLLILLVDYARRQQCTLAVFENLLGQKRPTILSAIGLPGTRSLARLIKRIELSPMLPWELEDVAKALTHKDFLTLLRHHPTPHLNHLRFLLRHPQPLWPGVLNLVNERTSSLDITWLSRMIGDTLNLAGGNLRQIGEVDSRLALQELHDRLVNRFNRGSGKDSATDRAAAAEELAEEHGDYPRAPIDVIEGIESLNSWLELLEEGATMRHCVGSYDVHIALGQVFIYRMMTPERLTISLEYRTNNWVVGEVRGHCNANPSPYALDIVRRWIER